jgi:thioredoxin-dependent peroxiredoxin
MTMLPPFSLPDQNGKLYSNTDFRGQWVVLYAYPKDDTPGCTTEACGFRDEFLTFAHQGITVVGISQDGVASHKKFAEKFHLQFPLLADTECVLLKALGAWGEKKFMGKVYDGILRNTYVINPDGEIVAEYKGITPAGHAKMLLADVAKFMHG